MEISTKGATELFASLPSSFHSSYATKKKYKSEREKRCLNCLPPVISACCLLAHWVTIPIALNRETKQIFFDVHVQPSNRGGSEKTQDSSSSSSSSGERDKSMGSCFTSFLELVLFPIPVRNSFTVMAVCYSV